MSMQVPGLGQVDLGPLQRLHGRLVAAHAPAILLATWFFLLSAMRLSLLIKTTPLGFDARLYHAATDVWLAGGDPWDVTLNGIRFAAPPPTLLAMLPFALLPGDLAVALLVALGVAASVWAIRKLRLPLWWLAFPPLVDGLWNANPQVLVVPLLLAGAAPIAVFVKAYAGVVPLIRLEVRALVVTAILLLVTAPFLPWATFIADFGVISRALYVQSAGGMSVWAVPILIPLALLAAWLAGRERTAWWAVPVFWPSTQWYYGSMALPAMTTLSAAVLAVPITGAPVVAFAVLGAEAWWARRSMPRGGSPPVRP